MAIIKGAISFGSNFNIGAKGPIDSRMRVETTADLTTAWSAEIPAFKGMSVVTMDTGKIWVLVDDDYTKASNWKEPSPKPVIDAENYTEAISKATVENIGQIVNISTGETVEDKTYSAGLYIVTGAGAIAKLGTTTASGDISNDVENLKTDVKNLQDTAKKLDGDETVDGSIKKQIKVADGKVRVDFAAADRALEEKITAVETAAKAAHTKVLDKAEGYVKVSTATDEATGKQTVTISEEDIASAKELGALKKEVGTKATTGDTATAATGLYKYVDDKVAGVPKYKVVKNDTTGGFNLVADGNAIDGSVEIGFKDYVVRSGKVVRGSWNEGKSEFAESENGDVTAIKLVLNVKDPKTGTDGEETIYIDATSLVDTYTVASGSTKYISINGYEIALTKDFIETIGKVATIETGLGELKTKVEALDSNSLKEITVNGHTINSGATSANIVTGEIKTGADIKLNESDETPVVKSGKTIDEVVKGIYTQINNLNGSKVESVTAVENSGVKVDNTGKNPKISLELEEHTNDTVAAGHIELQVDAKTGKLYGVMYYDTTDPESVSGTTA